MQQLAKGALAGNAARQVSMGTCLAQPKTQKSEPCQCMQVEASAQLRDAEARTKAVEAYAAVVCRLYGEGESDLGLQQSWM